MVRPAQTARSERTRDALRRAALVRFLAQGVEDTSAEQIAADAGVSLRTFYRHFASKQDLLFADYDAGLEWFRAALQTRSPDEPILQSVQSAIDASPYDPEAVAQIAALRAKELDAGRIVRHTRQVEAEFADGTGNVFTGNGSWWQFISLGYDNPAAASASQDYTIGNVILLPLFTIVDGYRRGIRRPWLYFVSSLFTSFAFAWAFYLATVERQRRHEKAGQATGVSVG